MDGPIFKMERIMFLVSVWADQCQCGPCTGTRFMPPAFWGGVRAHREKKGIQDRGIEARDASEAHGLPRILHIFHGYLFRGYVSFSKTCIYSCFGKNLAAT